jgi:hypothetical protein
MTSIETADSQGSGSEISATLVSLGERLRPCAAQKFNAYADASVI